MLASEKSRESRRTAILVSPQFPPCSLAAVHRVRHLAKHLPEFGWEPVVVCVHERHYTDPLDHRLAELLPRDLRVHKVEAAPATLSRAIGVSDVGLRAFGQLRRAVLSEIDRSRECVVFITGFPFYPMMMAADVRRAGVPLVLDFQDPWVSTWGARQSRWSKAGVAHTLATMLEPRAIAHADAVMSVSRTQNEQMAARYPDIHPTRFLALPIGGDADDFQLVSDRSGRSEGEIRTIRYVGSFAPRAAALFRVLLRGVRLLRMRNSSCLKNVRFEFIGTSATAEGRAEGPVLPIAQAEGVADLIVEQPRRIPYLDALFAMRKADVLLIVGSDEPHYTASKVFPALMAHKPFLSLFHEASSAHEILTSAAGGVALAFDSAESLEALEVNIASGLEALLEGRINLSNRNPSALSPYTARSLAGECARLFDRILNDTSSDHRCDLPS